MDPPECRDLIAQRPVATRAARGEGGIGEEAKRAESVVERNHDGASGGQSLSVIQTVCGATSGRAPNVVAPVYEDQHRQRTAALDRRPHVQRQAILLADDLSAHQLRTGLTELGGVAHSRPRSRRCRRSKPQRTHRRRSVGDPTKRQDVAFTQPAHLARAGGRNFVAGVAAVWPAVASPGCGRLTARQERRRRQQQQSGGDLVEEHGVAQRKGRAVQLVLAQYCPAVREPAKAAKSRPGHTPTVNRSFRGCRLLMRRRRSPARV